LPLILGSLVVTIGAMLIAVPFGIGTAVYLSEVARPVVREILKPLVEILAGLPSVMLGFLGIQVVSPFLREFLDLPTGLTAFAGSLLLGGMRFPRSNLMPKTMNNVPQSYRQARWPGRDRGRRFGV